MIEIDEKRKETSDVSKKKDENKKSKINKWEKNNNEIK